MAIIALDLGATKFSAKSVCNIGVIERSILLPRINDFQKETYHIKTFLYDFLNLINGETIDICVCSSAATIDSSGMVLRWPNRTYWEQYNLGTLLSNVLNVNVYFEDDGNLAAYAESQITGLDSLIYIGIGSGIAGGIVFDKQLMRGVAGQAAEFGHICVDYNGIRCGCGRKGCLQSYASGDVILKNIYMKTWQNKSKQDILEGIKLKQPNVINVLDIATKMLARALVNLSEIVNINTVIIGGGFGNKFPYLYERISFFASELLRYGQPQFTLLSAKWGKNSSLEGALYNAKIKYQTLHHEFV